MNNMTYQIKENAKNVWIRDNENTQDLSPLTDANSVYFNSGRTLEQELGKGVMESNIVTVNSSMEKVIDEAYDGVYESCVFKGKTKWIDNDTQEILDDFVNGRNLSLIDCKMPVLTTTGKNLFDGLSYIDGFIAQGNNYTVSSDNDVTSILVNVNKNTDYILSAKTKFSRSIVGGSLTPISIGTKTTNLNSERVGNTIKFNSGIYTYIIIYLNETKINIEDIQVEEGSVATPYEPYKSNILSTSEEIILREVGGVRDSYDALTGEYVQCIGEIVLDGSEGWGGSGLANQEETLIFQYNVSSNQNIPNPKPSSLPICDKFASNRRTEDDAEGILRFNGTNRHGFYIRIQKSRLSTPDYIGFKQWLSQNPITVQYELEAPVTTIVEPSTIPFIYQNGHIILESGYEGQSLTPILEYTTITNRTGQVENVAKTIRQHEAQLTLLEKMLITNIIELDYNNTLMALNLKMDEVK